MRIRIYQLDSDKDTRRVKFENYEQTERHGGVRASEYKCVFHGDVKSREGNRTLYGDVIAGPMYIVGEDTDGGFCGLTEKQVQKYKEMFAEPEDISPEEVEASIRFSFSPW